MHSGDDDDDDDDDDHNDDDVHDQMHHIEGLGFRV